jgi:hypothetical protein
MSKLRRRSLYLAAVAVLTIGVGLGARADIITSLFGPPVPDGSGGFNYTYSASITGGQDIESSIGPSFGTVYDFGPILGPITTTGLLSSAFTFTTSLTNTPAILTAPTDNPALLNIRFTDTSVDIAANTFLGTFTVDSPFGPATVLRSFDGQSIKNNPGQPDDDTAISNVGFVAAPSPVPGPAVGAGVPGFVLVSSGLLVWFSRRRRAQSFG